MKKFIFVFIGVLVFDVFYNLLYSSFFVEISVPYRYPFLLLDYLISSPAIFFNPLYPFYAPIPMYQLLLIFLGNVFIQSLLIYRLFLYKNRPKIFDE